jgi:phosphatidylglycerophosphatase A
MNQKSEATSRRPRLALAIATGFGLGYIPLAPGTWGSLLGLALAWALRNHRAVSPFLPPRGLLGIGGLEIDSSVVYSIVVALGLAAVGAWASGRAEKHFGQRDPQKVVIDEVSGQMIALFGAGWLLTLTDDSISHASPLIVLVAPNWKYLLLGLILFRVFDIWKPFPVRQAERLPGGWGIMADDWLAAGYAVLGLWLGRALGF